MTRSNRWALLVTAIVVAGAALVLAFVLSLSTTGLLAERHFVWLLWVNVAVAALLSLVIAGAAVRFGLRVRAGKFGSRLLAKLAGVFALVGAIPGLLIYGVSYQFVSRSIDTWFDVQVASALEAGLALGRGTLAELATDLAKRTRSAAERLADARAPIDALALEHMRDQLGVAEASLVGLQGQTIARAAAGSGAAVGAIVADRVPGMLLRQARGLDRSAASVEGLDDEPAPGQRPAARVRALARVPGTQISLAGGEDRFLMVVMPVPQTLVDNALAVQAAHGEYQTRAIGQGILRRMYIGTLTLALVLAVFGALLLAAMLGHQIVRPLLLLADGVRDVAAGDLTAKPVFESRDELGGLTRSFAQMTEQLADARAQVQRGVDALESARSRLQTILDSLTAGVIVFDRERRIDTVNPGATRILRQPLSAWRGRALDEVPGLADLARAVWQRAELHRSSPEDGERDHWQDAFELALGEQGTANLLLRGAPLADGAQLLVFDDITEVVSAQRQQAWAEVARRLAHEIKNPLTPIQLSAERIEHKLAPRLQPADAAMLQRSVATIVAQVQAMKQLVNEFRDYARLPSARLVPLELNALVAEVLGLYSAAVERGQLSTSLAEDLPLVLGDSSQLRQVIHNLVQNALDAVAEKPDGHVQVGTEIARDPGGAVRAVRLKVSDNGGGFADKVLKRAFEPYVTTKTRGTGLGLAVVKKIADEHGARIRIVNRGAADTPEAPAAPVVGAQVSLSFSRLAPPSVAPHSDAAVAMPTSAFTSEPPVVGAHRS